MSRMHTGAIIAAILLLVVGGWYLHKASRAPAPGTVASSTVSGSSVGTLSFGGVERTYIVHVPAGYDPAKKYPVMLSFHGNGGTGSSQESKTGFSALADQEGFIAVYPDSNPHYKDGGQWQLTGSNNDIAFTMALVSALESAYSVDTSRVYISGHSEGGGMTHALACAQTTTFAGFAVVSTNFSDGFAAACKPSAPITAIYFHGTGDPVSIYTGGNYKGGATWSAPQTTDYWVKANGCNGVASSTTVPDILSTGVQVSDTKQVWLGCAGGASVTFYTITGGGHEWPGGEGGKNSQLGPHSSLPASQIIWDTLSPMRR